VLEVFGSGTAAIVSPVKAIFYNNEVRQRGGAFAGRAGRL